MRLRENERICGNMISAKAECVSFSVNVVCKFKRCLSPDKTRKNDMIKILFVCHGNILKES